MNWQHERTMSPEEYAWIISRLGLDQAKLGRYLGVSERTSRRYVRGEARIPPAEVLLLRALVVFKVKPLVPQWRKGQN
jgi:DNA-binding transcriptional regulator YiaG